MSTMNKLTIVLFITLIITFFIITMVAMIGNTLIQETLDTQLKVLKSKGIKVLKEEEKISYFERTRHYEFVVEDGSKFMGHLQKYSDKQLTPYTNALLDGAKVGVDLTYSNIPFSKAISLDIYPLSLPSEMMQNIRANDSLFSTYIENFLFNKGFLYHIEYDVVSENFSGSIKDVSENYTLKNNAKVVINIEGTTFKGNGDLIAPSSLHVLLKKLQIKFLNSQEEMSILVDNLSSSATFENQTTYLSSLTLDSLGVKLQKSNEKAQSVDIANIYVNISSNTQNQKAEIHTKVSFKKMNAQFENLDINTSAFNYDFSIAKMDKEAFEALRILLSKSKVIKANSIDAQVQKAGIDLLSKGLKVNIIDFSINKIIVNKEDVKGFNISAQLDVEEDHNLASKMIFSPLLMLGNIDFDFKSNTSKKIFTAAIVNLPLLRYLNIYAQTKNDELELDVSYRQGSLKINGKTILGR